MLRRACVLQDAWSLVNELLVSLYRLKSKDVRAQICLATWHLDGWIPIAAILTNPMVRCLADHGGCLQREARACGRACWKLTMRASSAAAAPPSIT